MSQERKPRWLFYFPINAYRCRFSGILLKNRGIVNAVRGLGCDADMVMYSEQGMTVNDEVVVRFPSVPKLNPILNYFWGPLFLPGKLRMADYDVIWMRVTPFVLPYYFFLRQVRKTHPNVKVVLEYGAYPFVQDLKGFWLWADRVGFWAKAQLKHLANFFVTYHGNESVYGIPVIPLSHGTSFEGYEQGPAHPPLAQGEFGLLTVSSVKGWHGIDRIVAGLAEYRRNQPSAAVQPHLHIIGDGEAVGPLKAQAEKFGVMDALTFHGNMTQAQIDVIARRCHVAFCTLGQHRRGIFADNSLKNREYAVRGIPIVLSSPDEDFPASLPFVHYISQDEQPVNLAGVVSFFNHLAQTHPRYPDEIRAYADKHLSWTPRMQSVAEALAIPVSKR